jgi:hypothetical protein
MGFLLFLHLSDLRATLTTSEQPFELGYGICVNI